MPWSLDSNRFFVQENVMENSNILAELNPLGGGTVVHHFGYEDEARKINAYIVGSGVMVNFKVLAKQAGSVTLLSPWGFFGDFYVKKVTARTVQTICQSIDPTKPDDAIVYLADIELRLDA